MIPTSASRHLARRKSTLLLRRAGLVSEIEQIDTELAEIDEAERAITAPRNGRAVLLPGFLRGLPLTQKDRVLVAVRSRPKSGSTRHQLAEKLAQGDQPIGVNSISTYLNQLQNVGLVRSERGLWFPA